VKPLIGITLGDPAGIGPEIVLKALADVRARQALDPLLFGDRVVLEEAMAQTGLVRPLRRVHEPAEIGTAVESLPYFDTSSLSGAVEMGRVDGSCGRAAFMAIRTAIEWARAGWIDALVTAPINKASLQQGGVPWIDHSGMLADLAESPKAMTLFVVGRLRIFFLTKHIPLSRVSGALTKAGVVEGLVESDRGLRQLGLERRRIALAALNPHAGEGGLFGDEEARILAPAIAEARSLGLEVHGPIPADSVFYQCSQGEYDAVLSLYHDQGHIAAKTLDFHRTVSFTLGLPFLRTTPDHGTAFAIAGRNQANPLSMIEALLAAAEYCCRRG